jgi:hypothetical protein
MVVQTPMVIVVVVVMVVLVVLLLLLLLLLLPPSLPLLPTSLPHLALVKRARLHELIHNRRDQSREACCRVPTTRSSWEPRQAHCSAAALQVVPVFFYGVDNTNNVRRHRHQNLPSEALEQPVSRQVQTKPCVSPRFQAVAAVGVVSHTNA